jgi:hypothetical protein
MKHMSYEKLFDLTGKYALIAGGAGEPDYTTNFSLNDDF